MWEAAVVVVLEGGRGGGGGEATLANEARVLQQTASGYGAVHRPSADRREEVEAGGRAGRRGREGGGRETNPATAVQVLSKML